jgi:hypothetical protein
VIYPSSLPRLTILVLSVLACAMLANERNRSVKVWATLGFFCSLWALVVLWWLPRLPPTSPPSEPAMHSWPKSFFSRR